MMLQYYLPEMIRRRELLQEKSPILLILDGHTSRLSVDGIRLCIQFNIILLILPSHTSHITQPLDCSPNGSLKNSFAIHASKTMNHTCIDIRDVQKMEQSQMIQKVDQKGDEDDDISEVGDDEAMEEKVPPLPDAFFSTLGRNDYSQTSACQRRLLAAALPYALEKATSYESMRSGWKKSGLHPFDSALVLNELREGEAVPEKKLLTPSISGKILTLPCNQITIWDWRIQQLQKELAKKDITHARRDQIQTEIGTLEDELRTIKADKDQPCHVIDEEKQQKEENKKKEEEKEE